MTGHAAHWQPPELVDDLRVMYTHSQQHGLVASAQEVTRAEQIVGHWPRNLAQFIKEMFPAVAAAQGAPPERAASEAHGFHERD